MVVRQQELNAREAQMLANVRALWSSRAYDGMPYVEILEVREDRLFFRDPTAGEHGIERLGLVYEFFQFSLTPAVADPLGVYPLRRYDLVSNHKNWTGVPGVPPSRDVPGMTAVIGWQGLEQPSEQYVLYKDWTYEADFDLFSKIRDLWNMGAHFSFEWMWNGVRNQVRRWRGKPPILTNPFAVEAGLKARGIA